ncbi:baeRF2 domain-containing protein [Cellulomonas composti]|uniref:Peptide chain release factor 1 n=1 Tax=Cellulomonas composti TaxID=266130 RepID=A0A511J9H9_9CELL|nr:hypothetical protein [Cellulomonas composti]GEL94419.1 hypothetical protein CCO02nite_10770 [Cellulomonas composti]
MDLHWLKPLLGRPAPFTTVYLDVTRAESAGETEAAERWRAARRRLEREGAPAGVLDEIGELLAVPTRRREACGRVIIADANGVVVDRELSVAPAQDTVAHGPVPMLLPAVRAAAEAVRSLVVEIDRAGADLHWSDGAAESVEGGHDELHKTRDGLSRRGQTRAEDSWHRNAEAVALVLDRRAAELDPELVVLTGDVRAVALVRDQLGQRCSELVVEVAGGVRGEGVHRAFGARVAEAVDEFRERRRAAVLDRFAGSLGRGEGAVTSFEDVVEVLRRGQVDELVLADGAAAERFGDRELWVGPEPLQIATAVAELDTLGVSRDDARRLPAGVALVRAALGQDAGVTLAPDGRVELADGIGAVLRWSDGSTPSESLLSQSADVRRVRSIP